MPHPDSLERHHHSLLTFRRGHPAIRQWQFDVLVDVQIANQVEALKDEADLTIPDAGTLRERERRRMPPVDRVLAARGVSSKPRIERSVDLPQPDGPAIDTYSPRLISMLTLSKGVRLDLVGKEHLLHAIQNDQRLTHVRPIAV
jgi:hypothetical protein